MAWGIRRFLQTMIDPGALGLVALLAVGALLCFRGSRHRRVSAGVLGFLAGCEFACRLAAAAHLGMVPFVVAGLAGGAALAALMVILPDLALFGFGALLTTTFVQAVAQLASATVAPLWMALAAVLGGVAGLVLRRYALVVGTALYGAGGAVAGGMALVQGRRLAAAASLLPWPERGTELAVFLASTAVLATAGLVAQMGSSAPTRVEGKGR